MERRSIRPRVLYAVCGGLLASVLGVGFFLLHGVGPSEYSLERSLDSLREEKAVYAYVVVSGMLTLGLLGFIVGKDLEIAREQAAHDPLTGMLNRRAFDERLELELARSRRSGCPVSLLLLDVDELKRLNDEHGHDAGDRALRQLAERLARTIRATDAVGARIGGDEFVLIAPDTPAEAAGALAERIRREVGKDGPEVSIPALTVSIGVVTVLAGAEAPRAAAGSAELVRTAILSVADAALYRAKREGRDRIVAVTLPRIPAGPAGLPASPR